MSNKISDHLRDGDSVALTLNDGSPTIDGSVRFVDFAGVMLYVPSESVAFAFYPWSAIDKLEVAA
jgi:hypothetical protein